MSVNEMATTLDPVHPPKSLRELFRRHRWIEEDRATGLPSGPLSLRKIMDRHSHLATTRHRFLFFNTYLLVAPLGLHEKPARTERASEMAPILSKDYDIVALCEVFDEEDRTTLLASWPETSENNVGPEGRGIYAGSGLLTIVSGRSILKTEQKIYDHSGYLLRDIDVLADKGVLLSVIDVGVGAIELYSTHLYNGGDALIDPTDDQRHDSKMLQVDELIEFINEQHDPRNVVIIVGDFNIDGNHEKYYGDFMERFRKNLQIEMEDGWMQYALEGHGNPTPGFTTDGEPDDNVDEHDRICRLDTPDSLYCNDDLPSIGPSLSPTDRKRLDYILIQKPHQDHTFNLDVRRIRRRPFKRPMKTEEMAYMSDHLGLDTLFIASPKGS